MTKSFLKHIVSFLSLAAILVSCEIESGFNSTNNNDDGLSATFSSIEKKVLRPRCAVSGCHAADTKSAGLNLSTAEAYDNLVNVASILSAQGLKRVEPFDSDASFLIKVLDGSNPTRMPLNGAPLEMNTIETIKQWIDEGAKKN